jgi:hypothetical protein
MDKTIIVTNDETINKNEIKSNNMEYNKNVLVIKPNVINKISNNRFLNKKRNLPKK